MKVLRRSFLGAVLSSIPLLRAQADNSIEKYLAPLNTEGMGLILVDNKYIRDPFIKVYTSQDKIVKYKNHTFEQKGNNIIHSIADNPKAFNNYIPLTTRFNSQTKGLMIQAMEKSKKDLYYFELISDSNNSKRNFYITSSCNSFSGYKV